MNWRDQIHNHEIQPPGHMWSRICHDLDNDFFVVFKEKLSHQELSPPPAVWEKISQDLDNNAFVVFKDQLRHHEVEPPAIAWDNIRERLFTEEHSTPVIPLQRTGYKKFYQIAAAAAMVGILFFTVNYFISRDHTDTNNVASTQPKKENNETVKPQNNPAASDVQQNNRDEAKLIASNRLATGKKNNNQVNTSVMTEAEDAANPAELNIPMPALIYQNAKSVTDEVELSSPATKRITNLKGEIREDVSLMDLPNSYFYTTGPNGQSIRVSAKFRNTIQYLNGDSKEELLDVILRESAYWKNIFREWKEKVANSSFVPSAQNFMDITELLKLMQQNQNR